MASRLMAELARTARAVGGRAFPDVSQVYQRDFWPQSQFALDFPKAAALVPTVYACINRMASDVASTRPTFWEGDEDDRRRVKRKPGNIVDLYAKANPVETGLEVERSRQWSCDQSGNGYFFLEKFNGDPAAFELWSMPGHLVRPVSGPRRTVTKYRFGVLGSGVDLDPENVIPFRYPNPSFDPLEPAPVGLSPLEAARLAYETRFDMANWQRAFFKHGGAVAHIFNVKDRTSINDKEVVAMQEKTDERFRGIRNAMKPVFMAGVEVMRAGLTQTEMQYLETARLTDADICRVYGIPPVLMGIKEGGGLSDAGASTDSLIYWQNCLIPRIALRDAVLTEWLCPLYGKALFCDTDLSRVLPLMDVFLKQAEGVMKLVGRPIFTVNMALERLGLPESESPSADDLAIPFSIIIEGEEPARTPNPAAEPPQDPTPAPPPSASRRASASEAPRREVLRRIANADLARYERRMRAGFIEIFNRQQRDVLEQLRRLAQMAGMDLGAAREARLALNPNDLVPDVDEVDRKSIQTLYERLIAERGEAAAAEIGQEISINIQSGNVAAWVRSQTERALTYTVATTRYDVRESLARGIEAQESFSQLVGRVNDVFEGRRANALTIARTETQPAYNFATQEAWRESGVVEQKEWLTVGDDQVRAEHSAAEAAGPVDIEKPFDVGGNPAMYPGDPGLPPELSINCRCVIQPVMAAEMLARRAAALDDLFAAPAPSRNGHGKNRIAHLFAGAK